MSYSIIKLLFIISSIKCHKKCSWCQHVRGSTSQDVLENILASAISKHTLVVSGFGEPVRQYALYNMILNNNAVDYSIVSRMAFNQPKLAYRYSSVRVPIFRTDPLQEVAQALYKLRCSCPSCHVHLFIGNDADIDYCLRLLPWISKTDSLLVPQIIDMHNISMEMLNELIKALTTTFSNVIDFPFSYLSNQTNNKGKLIESYLLDAFNRSIKCPRRLIEKLDMLTIEANNKLKPCPFLPPISISEFHLYDRKSIIRELLDIYENLCTGCNWYFSYMLSKAI